MKNHYIFCEKASHKATDFKKVTNINARKRIVASNKMCFNYLCEAHQVIECESKGTCGSWQASHLHMLQVSRTGTIGCWKLSKTTSGDNKEARRDLSCRSYFGRWNKMPSSSRHRSWKILYSIGTG